jgi:predicted MPP superfamily phosphohydrolase
MAERLHLFPGLLIFLLSLGLQFQITWWLLDRKSRRIAILGGFVASTFLLALGYLCEFQRTLRALPGLVTCWGQAASLFWTTSLAGIFIGLLAWRSAGAFRPERRDFLRAAGLSLGTVPLAATGFGILERERFQVREVDLPIARLPKDLHGLRIVQITDIHLSPFLSEKDFARVIDIANGVRARLAFVTGDLITRRGDPLDACLRQLARLRADAGVLGCLGNHEIYTGTENYVANQGRRIGIEFLRHEARTLRFGNAALNVAGVDYQKFNHPYLVGGERLVAPGAINILLSHNPDVFPVAATQGYDLTIAGHTHGGQVNFELLHDNVNVARFFTPYVRGLYRQANASVYVSSGIGTIGLPVRLGAQPEISVLRLCAT